MALLALRLPHALCSLRSPLSALAAPCGPPSAPCARRCLRSLLLALAAACARSCLRSLLLALAAPCARCSDSSLHRAPRTRRRRLRHQPKPLMWELLWGVADEFRDDQRLRPWGHVDDRARVSERSTRASAARERAQHASERSTQVEQHTSSMGTHAHTRHATSLNPCHSPLSPPLLTPPLLSPHPSSLPTPPHPTTRPLSASR